MVVAEGVLAEAFASGQDPPSNDESENYLRSRLVHADRVAQLGRLDKPGEPRQGPELAFCPGRAAARRARLRSLR